MKNKKFIPVKKAGVKKGTKRGVYKKRVYAGQIETPVDKPVEILNNEFTPESETSGEEKLETFLKDYAPETGTNEPVTETATGTEASPEKPETDNKSVEGEDKPTFKEHDFTETEHISVENNLSEADKMVVNGRMLLALMNFIFPLLITKLFSLIDPRAGLVDRADVRLTEEQKESLEESADSAARYIFQQMNPILIFFVFSSILYADNFSIALDKIEKVKILKPKKK